MSNNNNPPKNVNKGSVSNANTVAPSTSTPSAQPSKPTVPRPNDHHGNDVKIDHTSPEWRCAVCHVACTQQCSLCKEVAYCGKPHQKDDWPAHKLTCRGNAPQSEGKCKLIYDYDTKGVRRGRKLIASKSLVAGELILRERPLVWVPKHDIKPMPAKADENAPEETPVPSACIVCGTFMSEVVRCCSQCLWPVCSEKCEKDSFHAAECKVFQGNHIPRHIQQLLPNRFLFVLRCLLLPSNDPKKWRQLMELEYNPEEMTKKYSPTDMFAADLQDDTESNRRGGMASSKYDIGITKLLKYYGIKCELEWVIHLMKVIKWNVIYDYEDDTRAMLFHLSSAANHSCLPNAELVYKKADGMMYIRCLVDLKPGEKITVSRDPLALMLTAQIRQRRLKYMTGWDGFRCNCARCSDWTELGTNFATLQCRKELKNWGSDASVTDPSPCTGTLVASRPLDQNFEWRCPVCKFKVSGDLTEDKLGMRNLLTQVFHFADADASYIPDGIQTVDSFKFWFHPSHSFIYQTKMRIMDTINLLCVQAIKGNPRILEDLKNLENLEIEGFKAEDTVQMLAQYGVECMKIADSIFPGCSRIRGHISHFLGVAKWMLFKQTKKQNQEAATEPDFVQFVDFKPLEEARKHFNDALKILSFLKDVKEDEGYMVKFAYNMNRRISQIITGK